MGDDRPWLRPILMTSFAFIMCVIPMVVTKGPGSKMREAIGISVFFGMLGVTLFGLMLTPAFYVLLRKMSGGIPLTNKHGTHAHVAIAATTTQE